MFWKAVFPQGYSSSGKKKMQTLWNLSVFLHDQLLNREQERHNKVETMNNT